MNKKIIDNSYDLGIFRFDDYQIVIENDSDLENSNDDDDDNESIVLECNT